MTNMTVSLVYDLLIGKSTDNYNLFFEKALKQDNLQPESIMTDFEIDTINPCKYFLSGNASETRFICV